MPNHYELLGISNDATVDDIKKAFRRLALVWHPDKWSGKSPEEISLAAEKFKAFDTAYAILSDSQNRAAYDQDLENPDNAQKMSENAEEKRKRDLEFQQKLLNELSAGVEQGIKNFLYGLQNNEDPDLHHEAVNIIKEYLQEVSVVRLMTEYFVVFIRASQPHVAYVNSDEIKQQLFGFCRRYFLKKDGSEEERNRLCKYAHVFNIFLLVDEAVSSLALKISPIQQLTTELQLIAIRRQLPPEAAETPEILRQLTNPDIVRNMRKLHAEGKLNFQKLLAFYEKYLKGQEAEFARTFDIFHDLKQLPGVSVFLGNIKFSEQFDIHQLLEKDIQFFIWLKAFREKLSLAATPMAIAVLHELEDPEIVENIRSLHFRRSHFNGLLDLEQLEKIYDEDLANQPVEYAPAFRVFKKIGPECLFHVEQIDLAKEIKFLREFREFRSALLKEKTEVSQALLEYFQDPVESADDVRIKNLRYLYYRNNFTFQGLTEFYNKYLKRAPNDSETLIQCKLARITLFNIFRDSAYVGNVTTNRGKQVSTFEDMSHFLDQKELNEDYDEKLEYIVSSNDKTNAIQLSSDVHAESEEKQEVGARTVVVEVSEQNHNSQRSSPPPKQPILAPDNFFQRNDYSLFEKFCAYTWVRKFYKSKDEEKYEEENFKALHFFPRLAPLDIFKRQTLRTIFTANQQWIKSNHRSAASLLATGEGPEKFGYILKMFHPEDAAIFDVVATEVIPKLEARITDAKREKTTLETQKSACQDPQQQARYQRKIDHRVQKINITQRTINKINSSIPRWCEDVLKTGHTNRFRAKELSSSRYQHPPRPGNPNDEYGKHWCQELQTIFSQAREEERNLTWRERRSNPKKDFWRYLGGIVLGAAVSICSGLTLVWVPFTTSYKQRFFYTKTEAALVEGEELCLSAVKSARAASAA